jgi:protocatechuate 3,4-dioxygenase beta subunit
MDTDPDTPSPAPAGVGPMGRRRALALIAGAGVATLAACASGGSATTASTASTTSTTAGGRSSGPPPGGGSGSTGSGEDGAIPEETAGPYPGDGSNGPDVLSQDGVVRQDIRSSFGSASGVAEGVPLAVDLTVVDAGSEEPMPGAAVYLWHCDREGRYSLYSDGVTDENYLRGVQAAGDDGTLSFTTVFPAAYSGRWPHIHFEVYGSVDEATGGGSPVATSQIALPEDVCDTVYATDGYDQSVTNMARTSLDSDNVFGDDGAVDQLATVTGTVADGLVASLTVPV